MFSLVFFCVNILAYHSGRFCRYYKYVQKLYHKFLQVTFKLLQFPDVVYEGAVLFFRNGRTKGWGTVKSFEKISTFLYSKPGVEVINMD